AVSRGPGGGRGAGGVPLQSTRRLPRGRHGPTARWPRAHSAASSRLGPATGLLRETGGRRSGHHRSRRGMGMAAAGRPGRPAADGQLRGPRGAGAAQRGSCDLAHLRRQRDALPAHAAAQAAVAAKRKGARYGPRASLIRRRFAGGQAEAATAFLSSRLTLSARGLSLSSEVFSSQLSRPPLCSTERRPCVETRNLNPRSSFSLSSVTFCRLGRKTRLVLLFAWLTLWPIWRPLPVSSQMRDMVRLSKILFRGCPGKRRA